MSEARGPEPASEATARRPVGAGAALITASNLVTAIGGGLIGVVVARSLGPDGAGAFNVVLSAIVILQVFSTLGIEVGLSYYVGGRSWPSGEALRQSQVAAAVLGLAAAAVGLAVIALLRASAFQGVSIGIAALGVAALPFLLSWTYGSYLALAVDRYEASALSPVSQTVITLALAIGLTPFIGLTGAVAAFTAGHALVAVTLLATSLRWMPRAAAGWLRRAPAAIRRAAVFGTKAQFASALQFVNQRVDLLVLNAVAAQATVGHYSIAVSVTMLGLLLPRALSAVVVPRIASLDATATSAERDMVIAKSARHAVIVTAFTSVVLAIGLPLIPLVYGSDFAPAVGLGFILLPGVAAFGYAGILTATVVGSGRPGYALRAALLVTPPTLVLYATLIPTLEAVGAAVASVVSYAATAALLTYYFRKVTGLPLLRTTIPTADELRDYRDLFARLRR